MKGAAIAASAAALGGAPESQAQAGCADFHTLNNREVTTELFHAVSDMEDAGFDTRVHMYYKEDLAAVPGIRTQDDAARYLADIEESCGVADGNTVSVFFSEGARLAYIRTGGTANDAIPDSLISEETPEFRQDLRDTESSFQYDIADMLNRLNPDLRSQVGNGNESPSSQDQATDIDMPWKEISIGAGVFALIALVGSRTYRGVTIRKITKERQESGELIMGDLGVIIRAIDEAIASLPPDDAPELRAAYDTAGDNGVELDDALDALSSTYREQRLRIWPNKRQVEATADTATQAERSSIAAERKAKEEFGKFEQQITTLYERSNKFDDLLSRTGSELSKLTEEGWDVTIYEKTNNGEFSAIRDEVVALVGSGYVDKPSDLLDKHEEALKIFLMKVTSLPERREVADSTTEGLNDKREGLASYVSKHNDILQSLRDEYNYDCYRDIDGIGLDSGSILAKMDEIEAAAKKEIGIKSAVSVETLEALLLQYQYNIDAIERNGSTIASRKVKLERIKEELPQRVEHLGEELQQLNDFVTHLDYPHDVEEDTKQMLATLIGGFAEFKQNDLVVEKPNYFALDNGLNSRAVILEAVKADARQQKQEIEQLRENLTSLQRSAQTDVTSLSNYLNQNRTLLSGSGYYVTGQRVPEIDLQAERGDLKAQVAEMRRFKNAIDQQEEAARTHVYRQRSRSSGGYGTTSASSGIGIMNIGDGGGGSNFGGGNDGGGGTSF